MSDVVPVSQLGPEIHIILKSIKFRTGSKCWFAYNLYLQAKWIKEPFFSQKVADRIHIPVVQHDAILLKWMYHPLSKYTRIFCKYFPTSCSSMMYHKIKRTFDKHNVRSWPPEPCIVATCWGIADCMVRHYTRSIQGHCQGCAVPYARHFCLSMLSFRTHQCTAEPLLEQALDMHPGISSRVQKLKWNNYSYAISIEVATVGVSHLWPASVHFLGLLIFLLWNSNDTIIRFLRYGILIPVWCYTWRATCF